MSNSSYSEFIESIHSQFLSLLRRDSSNPPELKPLNRFSGLSLQPRVMILSPHPDDECFMAGMPLRMQEEWGASVTVVPYSYGSDVQRREARALELKAAVQHLGFDLLDPRHSTEMERLNRNELMHALKAIDPEILVTCHPKDHHPTHVESSRLAESAAKLFLKNASQSLWWVQTEYWNQAESPNLWIPLASAHVTQIGEALMCHTGELARNPYHLSLPGWYMDQARRAPELISGFGKIADPAVFGQLLTCVQMSSAAS